VVRVIDGVADREPDAGPDDRPEHDAGVGVMGAAAEREPPGKQRDRGHQTDRSGT
jgi:hypothetical protein